ncbi:MAG TPA: ABC transporter permease [Candidatus Dormibacteraeota bacterium]|jgi:predicted permease|nr:ABC transporter permease [Candidatus Dormibacteraeota bacterium]
MTFSSRESFLRMQSFARKKPLDIDLEEEMASHLQFAIEENIQKGMTPQEAERRARISFGGPQQSKETHRESRGLPFLDTLLRDIRYTLRTLWRDRAFAAIAILILALGIGANIAVFSIINTLLLRPLPFANSNQLAWLDSNRGLGGLSSLTYKIDVYDEYAKQNRSFDQVTAYMPFFGSGGYSLTGKGEPRALTGVMVDSNFFQTLGVQPLYGRAFLPGETAKGAAHVAILDNAFWRQHFNADPSVLNSVVTINKEPYTIVGILPPSFDFGAAFAPGQRIELFEPYPWADIRQWGNTIFIIGRLKPGATVQNAQSEVDLLMPQMRAAHKDWYSDYATRVSSLSDHVRGKLRSSLIVLWSAVGLILLIVCVNLANLLFARSAARSKEFATRTALGAGRSRIVGQLLTESIVLSAAGAVLGLVFAYGIVAFVSRQASLALPLLSSMRIDGATLLWALLITAVAAVLFGLAPGFLVASANLRAGLASSSRGSTEGRHFHGLRSLLVISEVALACVLLVGAGLLLRSFLHVLDVDLGFQPSQAAALTISYDDNGNPEHRIPILKEILHRVQQIPGVEAAGISDMLPLGRNRSWGFSAVGRVPSKDDSPDSYDAYIRIVTPGYLSAMGMHLRDGRDFDWALDRPDTQSAVIINEAAARIQWPGQNPIGKLVDCCNKNPGVIIGVISDVRQNSLEDAATPEMFQSYSQAGPEGSELIVRSKLRPETLGPALIRTMREFSPDQPIGEFRPLQHIVETSTSPRRFFVLLVGSFATLGLILAALGIYGVISYMVTRQRQEIGIRMALGASRSDVLFGVVNRTLRLAFVGIAIGAVVSFLMGKWISSLLFQTQPGDPMTFVAMFVIFACVALLAGFIPAQRASRVDPLVALRYE